jgi:hypothetical protein
VFVEIKQYLSSKSLDNHNIPQYEFIIDDNNEIIPDIKILHTESLNAEMHNLGYKKFKLHCNDNKNKIVCYPSVWFGEKMKHHDVRDLFPPEWVKI